MAEVRMRPEIYDILGLSRVEAVQMYRLMDGLGQEPLPHMMPEYASLYEIRKNLEGMLWPDAAGDSEESKRRRSL